MRVLYCDNRYVQMEGICPLVSHYRIRPNFIMLVIIGFLSFILTYLRLNESFQV
jgi:hypothetical protein